MSSVAELRDGAQQRRLRIGVPKTAAQTDVEPNPAGVPVFFTAAHKPHHPEKAKHKMMESRLKYAEFEHSMAASDVRPIPSCGPCFASFLVG